jgi:hypothetical protein
VQPAYRSETEPALCRRNAGANDMMRALRERVRGRDPSRPPSRRLETMPRFTPASPRPVRRAGGAHRGRRGAARLRGRSQERLKRTLPGSRS